MGIHTRVLSALLILMCSTSFGSTPEESTGRVGGCSCVIISPSGYALTAEHCGIKVGDEVIVGDTTYGVFAIAYRPPKNNTDEAVVIKLSGAETYPFVYVSVDIPRVGDKVFSLGYPRGKWARSDGEVVLISENPPKTGEFRTAYEIRTNFGSAGGGSGGPLFDEKGRVIGLTSTTSVNGSVFIGLGSINKAIKSAAVTIFPPEQPAEINPDRPDLVVFSRTNCPPCESLKDDVRGGAYAAWNVIWTEFDGTRWSTPWIYVAGRKRLHPELDGRNLHLEFQAQTGGRKNPAPTIWVRYTDDYYSGNQGLLAWLRGILSGIRNIIIGEPAPTPGSPFEVPDDPEKYERSPASSIAALKDDVAEALRMAGEAREDAKAFSESGLIGKARKGLALKSDVNKLKAKVGDIKDHWAELKHGFSDPRALLNLGWGVLGWLYRRRDL
jgi:hypothetical protein